MHVQHRQRLCIGQRRRFDRSDATATPLEIILRGLVAFEERAVQRNVARVRVLLRGDAQQRPPDVHRIAVERDFSRRLVLEVQQLTYNRIHTVDHRFEVFDRPIASGRTASGPIESKEWTEMFHQYD